MAESRLDQIIYLVRECGQLVKDADRHKLHVASKAGHANFVTDYDKKVQDRLKSGLLKIMPDAHFMGEEGTTQGFSPKGKFFIVDPIDGTTNFIKDFRASSISVALVVDGAAELGAIYNPYLDEMFTAMRGQGAFCNGKRIHVSSEPLENGLVIFGTSPYNEELSERSFKLAYSYFRKSIDVRRTGSAALDMCSVAAGRAELFFEMYSKIFLYLPCLPPSLPPGPCTLCHTRNVRIAAFIETRRVGPPELRVFRARETVVGKKLNPAEIRRAVNKLHDGRLRLERIVDAWYAWNAGGKRHSGLLEPFYVLEYRRRVHAGPAAVAVKVGELDVLVDEIKPRDDRAIIFRRRKAARLDDMRKSRFFCPDAVDDRRGKTGLREWFAA